MLRLALREMGLKPERFTNDELDALLRAGYTDGEQLRIATYESLRCLKLRLARVDNIIAGEDAGDWAGLDWAGLHRKGFVTQALGAVPQNQTEIKTRNQWR